MAQQKRNTPADEGAQVEAVLTAAEWQAVLDARAQKSLQDPDPGAP